MKTTSSKRWLLSSRSMFPVYLAAIAIAVIACWMPLRTTATRLMATASVVPPDSSVASSNSILPRAPVLEPVLPIQNQSTFYLHGSGPVDNPPTLFIDGAAPSSSSAKDKDSPSISRTGGNPWKEVGTWPAASSITTGTISSLSDLHVWLGLKNSDDQGTYFDLRVEAYKNGSLLTSGESRCITGVTRNATSAKEVTLGFASFSPAVFNGTSDVLSMKVLTRVGTDAGGASCGGHSSAVGLRLYFDATTRSARFNAVMGGDATPPVLTVNQPPDNLITSASQINVSGSFSDQSSTTITVNGVATQLQGSNFTSTISLAEGQNSISIVALDSSNNRTEVTRHVTQDKTPPLISVESPADFSYTKDSQVEIVGTLTDTTPATITVDGAAPTVSGNTFRKIVSLPNEGVNTIVVHAVDAAGNESELFQTVNRDTTPPAIVVNSPAAAEVSRLIKVQGTVTDAATVTVSVNGVQVPTEDGAFERQLEAPEGSQQVRVTAVDAAGNQTEVVRTVIIDLTSPLFSNVSPADGSVVRSPAVVAGHVADANQVTVRVNDVTATVEANGNFTAANVPLVEGSNELLLTATDTAGNENNLTLTLVGQDQTAPAAPVLFPINSPTRLAMATLEGQGEPGASIMINGGSEPVTVNAAFGSGLFAANVNLSPGTNSFSVVARDAAGNSSPAIQISIISDPNMALPPAGQPAQINISTGNAQRGLVDTSLPRPMIVIITDQAGNPVSGVTAKFSVQAGGGYFAANNTGLLDVNTDAQGYARAIYVCGAPAGHQEIRADFAGNSLTPVVFFADALASSGSATTVSGTVLDQNLRALPNVLVRIGGQQTRTRVDGNFQVANVATGPHQLLELIGRDQISLPGRWPNITYDMDVLPGVDNQLGRPLFLPKVNDGVAVPLDANSVVTQDTTFELPVVGGEAPVRVTARAGTHILFPPDVTDKRLSVTRIPKDRVPMTLEDGRATNLYVSVQPSGAIFETPLEISFPNLDRLEANSQVLLMSFDHDAGRYVQVGTGHVTADGREVKSDPGSGIRVGAWHGVPPPPPQPQVTVLGHIQIEGNPAFEGKTITKLNAWVDGAPASAMPNPTLQPVEDISRIELKVSLPLARGELRTARMESTVVAEKKLKIKFDSYDSRFAPSAERFNFKYTITPPDSATPQVAKFEVFKAADLNNPIYVDSAIPLTANKLDYAPNGTAGWDGKANQGTDSGKYIEPKDGPFTVRLSVATKTDLSDLVKDEKVTKVEIDSMEMTPDSDFKSFKPSLTATEIDNPIELVVKIKNKAGNGVVTEIPFHIKWSFDDPDDTAGDNQIDLNGGAGDDNAEVRFGGKRADANGASPGKIMWKTVSGFTATVSADGQSAESDVVTSGGDQGKTKLTFSTSVIGGDNYHLIAKYLNDGGQTVKEKKSGKWSVWKRLNFQNVYRMNGGADVDTIMNRTNINPAFNGDGYTDYNLGRVVRLANGAASPQFVSPTILAPNAAETPAPNDTPQQIQTKAQAWFERNRTNINAEFAAYIIANNIPAFSVIGAKYYHPKYDGNTGTGQTNYWPSGIQINSSDPGAAAHMVDPDGEWGNVQGSEGGERAFIFLNISIFDRAIIVGRHEVGHGSDHVLFDYPTSVSDHATSGVMHPTADQSFTNPLGVNTFSPDSIRRLRGSKQ